MKADYDFLGLKYMAEGYNFDEDDKMDKIKSDYQANGVSDNLRICSQVDSMSKVIPCSEELPEKTSKNCNILKAMLNQHGSIGYLDT